MVVWTKVNEIKLVMINSDFVGVSYGPKLRMSPVDYFDRFLKCLDQEYESRYVSINVYHRYQHLFGNF